MREKSACGRYLRQVERRLRCSGTERKRLLVGLRAELDEAAAQMPEPTLSELEERFGRPGEVAQELEEALEPGAVVLRERLQNWSSRVLAMLTAAALLLSAFWFLKYQEALDITDKIHVIVDPVRVITEEEMNEIFGPWEGE